MNNKEYVLSAMRDRGRVDALAVQNSSSGMTGTELNAKDSYIPNFKKAVKTQNMFYRKAGKDDGFVCKSTAGRVVRLIQNYDSDVFTAEPEELSAQWRFVWSTDPAKAQPFVAISTSPYAKGDCCLNKAGLPKVSNIDDNVFDPDDNPRYWDDPA